MRCLDFWCKFWSTSFVVFACSSEKPQADARIDVSPSGSGVTAATTSSGITTAQSSSVNDIVTTTAASSTIELTSSTSHTTVIESAASSDSSSGTATSAESMLLTSPSLEGVAGCSASNVSVCPVFPNDNISYMANANLSPEFTWSQVPMGTRSFALTLKDVTYGQPLWAVWNIPATETGLPADLAKDVALLAAPAGAEQSNASFADGDGYYGPQAPCNVFQFELFALSLNTFEPNYKEYAAEVDAQLNALGTEVLARATLAGRTNYDMMCE